MLQTDYGFLACGDQKYFVHASNISGAVGLLKDDEIEFEVQIINKVKSFYKFGGVAIKKKIKVCEAEFSAMIINRSSNEIL